MSVCDLARHLSTRILPVCLNPLYTLQVVQNRQGVKLMLHKDVRPLYDKESNIKSCSFCQPPVYLPLLRIVRCSTFSLQSVHPSCGARLLSKLTGTYLMLNTSAIAKFWTSPVSHFPNQCLTSQNRYLHMCSAHICSTMCTEEANVWGPCYCLIHSWQRTAETKVLHFTVCVL